MMKRADQFGESPIDPEEAKHLIQRAEIILDDLPRDLYPAALDDALFFLIRAHRAVGNDEAARAALDRLRRESPKSRYLAEFDATIESHPGKT